MRIVTEPEIYVVGRQTLDNAEVQRFLKDHETYWETDSENNSELIVELAGRTCFDAETEVLTDQGWKRFSELDKSEKVLTLNPETRFVEFQRTLIGNSGLIFTSKNAKYPGFAIPCWYIAVIQR